MIDRILENYRASAYDFRICAKPDDPLSYLFPEWVPYYRLKAAIAQTIAPASILEIGVRYGYSAAAFLHGSPHAKLTGIDLDVEDFGGAKGAIAWARQILPAAQAELVFGNSQEMTVFPGTTYDLIHIDGQQDGDGTYRDLEKALRQGQYILLDGYYWTRQNFHAATEFLYQYKGAIDYSFVIPSYAGELLIRVKPEVLFSTEPLSVMVTSQTMRKYYDAAYFQQGGSGWDSFAASRGKRLTDVRLRAIFDLTMSNNPKRILDLGCGRGEISVAAARQDREVSAIDYSEAAIEIAKKSVNEELEISDHIAWSCQDATAFIASPAVDTIVAADLVEHLSLAETSRLVANAAASLAPAGCFIVHTSSNKWFSDYHYPQKRRHAASLGAYLPPNPGSPFGRRLQINEQSPQKLRRLLRKHFRHVLLWFGSLEDPAASLRRVLRPRDLAMQAHLYAVASQQPIDASEILRLFACVRLAETDFKSVKLVATPTSLHAKPRETISLSVEINNESEHCLCSQPPDPVYLSYHWLDTSTNTTIVWDGERTPLVPAIQPNQVTKHTAYCLAPDKLGEFLLQVTLVQEGVEWFDRINPAARTDVKVIIY